MHCWNGLVCHPKQYRGSIDRQLQPPPPGDDVPSLLKNGVQVLDHGSAGPKFCGPFPACAHIADHPISLYLGCYESQIFDYVEKIAIRIFFEVVNTQLDIHLTSVACSLKHLTNRANLKLSCTYSLQMFDVNFDERSN